MCDEVCHGCRIFAKSHHPCFQARSACRKQISIDSLMAIDLLCCLWLFHIQACCFPPYHNYSTDLGFGQPPPEMVLYFYNAYATQPQRVFNGHPPLATMGHRRASITTIRTVIPPVNPGNGWFDTVGTVVQSGQIWFTWRVWCGIGSGSGVGREW